MWRTVTKWIWIYLPTYLLGGRFRSTHDELNITWNRCCWRIQQWQWRSSLWLCVMWWWRRRRDKENGKLKNRHRFFRETRDRISQGVLRNAILRGRRFYHAVSMGNTPICVSRGTSTAVHLASGDLAYLCSRRLIARITNRIVRCTLHAMHAIERNSRLMPNSNQRKESVPQSIRVQQSYPPAGHGMIFG